MMSNLKQKKHDDISNNSIVIRYSNQILYYFIWFGGILSIASSTLLLSDVDWDKFYKSLSFIDYDTLGILLFLSIILFAFIAFLLPFFASLYITDKKACASFSKTNVEIQKSGNIISVNYIDIERIKFVNVLSSSQGLVYTSSTTKPDYYSLSGSMNGNARYGPYLYRVIIYTHNKKYKINCSFKEAWQCRRKKTPPTIYTFTVMLEKQSGRKVEYTTNTWG